MTAAEVLACKEIFSVEVVNVAALSTASARMVRDVVSELAASVVN